METKTLKRFKINSFWSISRRPMSELFHIYMNYIKEQMMISTVCLQ